jgi:hypothetical protein
MTKKVMLAVLAIFLSIGLAPSCSQEKLPSRDEIPILRKNFFALQQAVLNKNRGAIDSLTSAQIVEKGESADSLLSLVYGPNGDFAFKEFSDYSIFFGNNVAVISCKISDSSGTVNIPAKFTYKKYDKSWLLAEFKTVKEPETEQ